MCVCWGGGGVIDLQQITDEILEVFDFSSKLNRENYLDRSLGEGYPGDPIKIIGG